MWTCVTGDDNLMSVMFPVNVNKIKLILTGSLLVACTLNNFLHHARWTFCFFNATWVRMKVLVCGCVDAGNDAKFQQLV